MPLTPAQRIELGLDDPANIVSEFGPPPLGGTATGQPPVRAPNVRLILNGADKATSPKIRQMLNELLAANMDNANYWLQQVAASNPKVALELYLDLCQFSIPKLKAVAVQVDDRSDNPRTLSTAQLMQALQGD
jgi:hypothetical protein